ncbi:MAG TPA: hypothetical protein PKD83_06950 [Ignavibacteria bacterium]|nr:hypothetical protein [Ignavibacteria bacterium]
MKFKKYLFLLAALIFISGNSFSQEKKINITLSHPISAAIGKTEYKPKKYIQGADSFKVVAIMVQFVPDTDPRTTGTGLFDLSNQYFDPSTGKDTIVDAPPYDSAYFADHLEFLKNYYSKSSKGKLNISYELFGTVINLPNNMETYSPQKGESNIKLGNMFQQSWAAADSFINFSNYNLNKTAFVIFHAGVGRDIDVSSIVGFDPTPYNIPSVYLGLRSLKEFYGATYQGYQTNDGAFITNSLIIPSTESRSLDLISGTFLIELGMNGILASSFGSYLGLPDLFNTVTGKTAIGRFGLMDGQSLFSYNGIFPPEPSAWEKVFLGWIDPVVISSGLDSFVIPTSSKNIPRDTSIYKVLMNSKEYFLIENRNRDPENTGVTIYSRNRQFNDADNYPQDLNNGFYYSNAYTSLYLLNGNITDVSHFDWSLPGLINNENNFKGGILIWHIDENVIEANYLSNTINNDINHKGVDLEEAKGAQEIGITFNTFFGPVTGDGTPVDYWFFGYHAVPSSVYQNSFNPTSLPNSLSYSLANNNIIVSNFNYIDTLMTFSVSVGSTQLSPLKGFPKFVGVPINVSVVSDHPVSFDFNGDGKDEFFVNNGIDLYGFKNDGTSITSDSTGLLLRNYGQTMPSVIFAPSLNNSLNLVATSSSVTSTPKIGFFKFNPNYQLTDSVIDNLPGINSIPLVFDSNMVVLGVSDRVYERKVNGQPSGYVDSNGTVVINFSRFNSTDYIFSNNLNSIVTGNIVNNNSTDTFRVVENSPDYNLLLNGKNLVNNYSISSVNSDPVLADINQDGRQDIIFIADNKVFAVNSNGVLLDNFPFNLNKQIKSGIAVCDINNDNVFDLIFVTTDGNLYAYGANGKVVSGFPVMAGVNTSSSPAIANLNDTLGILIYGNDGYLYAFKTNNVYNENNVLWKNHLKDKYHSNGNFSSDNSPITYSGGLPSDRVYNWPNPVYGNETFIRYFLNGNASSVTVKILDLSGELVTNLTGTMYSNSDNEVKWDASTVQSGIYYGVVEAVVNGTKDTQVFKIAVIK